MLLGRHDELFVGGFGEKSIGKVEKQGGSMLLGRHDELFVGGFGEKSIGKAGK